MSHAESRADLQTPVHCCGQRVCQIGADALRPWMQGGQETGEILLNRAQKVRQGMARDVNVWFARAGSRPGGKLAAVLPCPDRLRKLEAAGVIERRLYSEHPPRYEYHLTEAGRELFPVMLALRQWGDKWAVDAPVLTHRHSCGQPVQVDLVCHHCGRLVTHDTIHAELTGS